MEPKRFGEIEPGTFFLDNRLAFCMKTLDVECLQPDEEGIIWDVGFNALEFNKGRYYKQRFKGKDLVTVINIYKDLELLINKIG